MISVYSYSQSKMLKDKMVLYMLVVALVIGNFSLDLSAISVDLKRGPTRYNACESYVLEYAMIEIVSKN